MKLILSVFLFSISAFASDHGAASAKIRMGGWEAFSELQNGNMRFYEGRQQHPRQDPILRDVLASGQKPHTILISCSDSRVPPEEIFDQGLGDIFSVRLAGNVITAEGIASVEYAVAHLGPKLIIVMGHESCGAIGAAITSKVGVSNGSESLDKLVTQIRGNLSAGAVAGVGTDKIFRQPVKENVTANIKELLKKSEIVRKAMNTQGLLLGQAIYSLKTGRVEFWDVGSKLDVSSLPDAPVIQEVKVSEEVIVDKGPKKTIKKTKAPVHH